TGKRVRLIVQRPLQLGGAEELLDRCCGEPSVARESQGRGINRRPQLGSAEDRHFLPGRILRQHDLRVPIAAEVSRVDTETALGRRLEEEVQALVAGKQIGMAVVIEIPSRETPPPATRRTDAD